jgi:hypothetical protein
VTISIRVRRSKLGRELLSIQDQAKMVKTRSTSDDQGENSLPPPSAMEPNFPSIVAGYQELSPQFAISQQHNTQLFTAIQEDLRILKCNQRSPPPATQPPPSTHQFHTPRPRDTHTFCAPSQFEPQHHATYDQFSFQHHSRRPDHPSSNDFYNKDDVWHTHEQLPK